MWRESSYTCFKYRNALSIDFRKRIEETLSKKSFVLRIDDKTYSALEKWASDEFRSVNGQIEWLIDKSLKEADRKKDASKELTKQSKK